MAHIRQRKSGSWEVTIRGHGLPRPIHASAASEAEARAWAREMEARLDAGILPVELVPSVTRSGWTVARWLGEYETTAHPSPSDRPLLRLVDRGVGRHALEGLRPAHVAEWVATMKRERLTPGSIRKRVAIY